jgi:tetratricopeptide (TPR) repeat protein
MQPWAAAVAGDWATATSPVTTENRINRMFATLTRARLLERARKYAEADAVFKSLTAEQDSGLFALSYGAFLERRGRRADAVAVYERSIGVSGDPMLEHARNRARRGRAPAIGSLEEGAAETLLAPAALQLTRRQPEIALALLRLVLRLDPTHDEAWMLVGDAMSAAGDAAASREAYTKVRPSSPEYIVAQGRLAWSLQREGNSDGALKLAELQIDRSKGSAQALSVYAELLRENGRFLESVAVMDKLIARAEEAPEAWRLYYFRGVSYERAGQWEKAEADLQHALSLKSDEPEVMNYLGYGWADRGERLAEALAMLEKAATLRPRSGEIRDSLGWARYRLGLYPEAVQDLERAVAMAPADPNINDHLGDAYWMVGRRLEAEFQWRRVLTLEPSPELRAAVEVKLKHGIEGASPSALAAADLRQ